MHLLQTQINEVLAAIDDSPFERHEILIDQSANTPILRFAPAPNRYVFVIGERYQLHFSPGEHQLVQDVSARYWSATLTHIQMWLRYLKRELVAAELRAGESNVIPDWAIRELPSEYAEAVKRIAELEETERRLRRMAGLLSETGDVLNRLVRDAFREIGFEAAGTQPGATYDVTVTLPMGRLLLALTLIRNPPDGSPRILPVTK